MVSYAQNCEDVILVRVFRDRERGFYIDVGAWHPEVDSVTQHFYARGWHGINIEPMAEYHSLLERNRPRDLNLRVALGDRRETRRFYRFAASGLSTFSAEFRQQYAALGLVAEETEQEVLPLAEVCARHVHGEIDFLKIDVEGWEEQVLRGGDWVHHRPRIVLVEAVLPAPEEFLTTAPARAVVPAWESWEKDLCSWGYDFCYFDGLNRFYVRQEEPALKAAFSAPPNVYDRFEPYALWQMRAELQDLEQQHAALAAAQQALVAERDELKAELERLTSER